MPYPARLAASTVIKLATAPNRVKFPARVEAAASINQPGVSSGRTGGCTNNTVGTLEMRLDSKVTTPINCQGWVARGAKGCKMPRLRVVWVKINSPANNTNKPQSTQVSNPSGWSRRQHRKMAAVTSAASAKGTPATNAPNNPTVTSTCPQNSGVGVAAGVQGGKGNRLRERTSG